MSEEKQQQFATLAVHAGQVPDPTTGAASTPIFQTSSYVFHDAAHAGRLFGLKEPGYIYSRIMNPTTDVLEQRVAALESGAAALATASGLAAEDLALSSLADSGDEIVSTTSLYGGTYSLLAHTFPRRNGVKVHFVDADDFAGLSAAINDKTKALYTETLGNPKLDVSDIETLAKIAHDHKLPLVIDNTAVSPALVRPIEWGADIVVNSATKFLSGHGSVIAGVIVDSGKFDWAGSGRFKNFTDPDPSYHGLSYTDAFGPLAFIYKARVQGLAQHRRDAFAFQRLDSAARHRDAAPAVAAALGECAGRGQAPGEASRRDLGQLSRPGVQQVLPARAEISARRAGAVWSPSASRVAWRRARS
jgi:O-acetylhomoserine (thiol)-lyase